MKLWNWLCEHSRWVFNNKGFWAMFLKELAKASLKQQSGKAAKASSSGKDEEIAPIDLANAIGSAFKGMDKGPTDKATDLADKAPVNLDRVPGQDVVTTGPGGYPIVGQGEITPSLKDSRLMTPQETQSQFGRAPLPSIPEMTSPTGMPQGIPQIPQSIQDKVGFFQGLGKGMLGAPIDPENLTMGGRAGTFLPDVLRTKLGLDTSEENFQEGVEAKREINDPYRAIAKMKQTIYDKALAGGQLTQAEKDIGTAIKSKKPITQQERIKKLSSGTEILKEYPDAYYDSDLDEWVVMVEGQLQVIKEEE